MCVPASHRHTHLKNLSTDGLKEAPPCPIFGSSQYGGTVYRAISTAVPVSALQYGESSPPHLPPARCRSRKRVCLHCHISKLHSWLPYTYSLNCFCFTARPVYPCLSPLHLAYHFFPFDLVPCPLFICEAQTSMIGRRAMDFSWLSVSRERLR